MLGTYSPQTISLTPALGWNNYYERSNLQQKELVKKGAIFLILSYHVSSPAPFLYTVNEYQINDSYKKIQQDATVYQNLLFHIYMKLNMFRATHRPSSGA